MTTNLDAARQLAGFLTERSTGYGATRNGASYLEQRVQLGIEKMAQEIAREVIDAHPELFDLIRGRVADLVSVALRDDAYLSGVVTTAVASGLGQLVAARARGDEDD